jgi:Domain of unknown function (DUF4270)
MPYLFLTNMKNILTAFSAFALLLTSLSCNDSSLLGADLFQGEKLNLTFTDTVSINAVSEKVDSVLLHTTGFSYDSLLLGKVNDPIFGLTDSRIYTVMALGTTSLPSIASTAVLDSAFFDLVYAPSRINGDTLNQQSLGIYRVTETITDENIYSNHRLYSTESTPIGTKTFKPNPYSSVISILKTDTTYYTPRVRVPINPTFAKQFLDTSKLSTLSTWLNGFEIRSETTTNTMLGFNFGAATTAKPNPTAIRLYYKNAASDTSSQILVIPVSTFHFSNFKHDIASAPVKNFLNNQAKGDSLLYIQGMAGPNVKIEFPYLTSLIKTGNIAINKAELEVTISKDSKTDIYPAIDQLVLRTAQFAPTLDLNFDDNYGSGSVRPSEKMTTSGGYVRTEIVNGETVQKYYFNLSSHLNEILSGRKGSTIYISHLFKEEKSARVLLYGPKSTKYKAKLNLYYTKI